MRPLHLALLVFAVGTPNSVAALVSQADVMVSEPVRDPWSGAPLSASQSWLLDSAYAAASAFPLNPHIKNRSRAQEAVVVGAFELDQPALARRFAQGIANWRRGAALADVAHYAVLNDLEVGVQEFMDEALQVAADHSGQDDQAWRKERILGKLNQVQAFLKGGETKGFAELSDQEFESELAVMDQVLHNGTFEQVRAALNGLALSYGSVFDLPERRDAIEAKIMESKGKMPRLVHIQVGFTLVDQCIEHGDSGRALALLGGTREIFSGGDWLLADKLPLIARMASLRFRAGEKTAALSEAKGAWLAFEAERDNVVNIERADALIPLAEAYVAFGELGRAHELYAIAIEEGMENPNSRPRTDDLIAALVSMAVHGVEPSEALITRVNEIRAGLGDPW